MNDNRRRARRARLRRASAALTLTALCWGCESGPQPPDGLFQSADARERGHALFEENCALCHGEKADGHGQRASALSGPPANFANPRWRRNADPGEVFQVIRKGLWGTSMPAWPTLEDQEVWDLVAYLFSVAQTPIYQLTVPAEEARARSEEQSK